MLLTKIISQELGNTKTSRYICRVDYYECQHHHAFVVHWLRQWRKKLRERNYNKRNARRSFSCRLICCKQCIK